MRHQVGSLPGEGAGSGEWGWAGAQRLLRPGSSSGSSAGGSTGKGTQSRARAPRRSAAPGHRPPRLRAPADGCVPPGSGGGGGGAALAGRVVRGGPWGAAQVPAVEQPQRGDRDLCHSRHHRGLHRPGSGRGPSAGGAGGAAGSSEDPRPWASA